MKELTLAKGYKISFQYNKTFICVFYHNIINNKRNIFKSNEEANFSTSKTRFSVLKYIDERFLITGKYEFIMYYDELNATLHWEQTRSIHWENSDTSGYNPLDVDPIQITFKGLGITNRSCSYLDGNPDSYENWWYCVGARTLHTDKNNI